MERLMNAFKKYDRALTTQCALPHSQKERERHKYDKAKQEFETEFESCVKVVIDKHEKVKATAAKAAATKAANAAKSAKAESAKK